MKIAGIAAALLGIGLAYPATAQQRSLIVVDWIDYQPIPESCPLNHICMNVHGLIDLDYVETLIGPRLPQRIKVKLWFHSDPLPTSRYILAVEPGEESGTWIAHRVGLVRDGNAPCVNRERLEELGLRAPRTEAGRSRICFRSPRALRT